MGSSTQLLGRVYVFPVAAERRRVLPYAALPESTRADVAIAARSGRLHPDPMVAISSLDWARRRLTPRSGVARLAVIAVAAASSAGVFGDAPDADGLARWWRDRRLARRIVAAAERSGVELPEWPTPRIERPGLSVVG